MKRRLRVARRRLTATCYGATIEPAVEAETAPEPLVPPLTLITPVQPDFTATPVKAIRPPPPPPERLPPLPPGQRLSVEAPPAPSALGSVWLP